MDTDTPRVDACANGDLSIYPLARQLERELSEARAECERLREDAERYRWLITEGGIEWNPAHDAAIDAARKP